VTERTERLIDGLVEDLAPVTPLPRLRSAFAVVLAVWAAVLGVVLGSQEATPGARSLTTDPVYIAAFLGLLFAAFGGTLSALAAGQPGRGRIETLGLGLSLFGLLGAAIACLIGVGAMEQRVATPPGADLMCLRHGVLLSLLPGGVVLSFLVRGWTAHPVRASTVGLAATGALGAAIVHLSCDFMGPRHLLIGHLSVPVALAILGLYPLAVLLRRLRG
jgi:hypothetical protein